MSSLSVTPVKSSSEMSYSCKEPSRIQEEEGRAGGVREREGGERGATGEKEKKKMRKMTTQPRNIPPLDSTSQVLKMKY